MISHQNILTAFVYAFGEVFPELWTHEHRGVSHLSLAHIFERNVSIYFPLLYDFVPYIGEKVEYLQETRQYRDRKSKQEKRCCLMRTESLVLLRMYESIKNLIQILTHKPTTFYISTR